MAKTESTKITRITASEPKKEKTPKKIAKTTSSDEPSRRNVFVRIGGYFKGAWYELRQVRWPDRKATWSLTLAVLLFTVFFVVLIVVLDALFKYLSGLVLG